MLVVDASVLYEVVADSPAAPQLRDRLAADSDHVAPHLVDAEVGAVIQRHHLSGLLDGTAANQAVMDLRAWPAERWSHGPLLARAWELRENVRMYDGLYVALAEALAAPLLTRDARLARAPGLSCAVEVL